MKTDRTITQRNARYRKKLATERGMKRIEVVVPVAKAREIQLLAERLRRQHDIENRPNAEAINDRVRLIHHRLVARRLRQNPGLAVEALRALDRREERFGPSDDLREWREMLTRPVTEIGRFIASRSSTASRMRIASPFPFVSELTISDPQVRRRLWRIAGRPFARSRISSAPSEP